MNLFVRKESEMLILKKDNLLFNNSKSLYRSSNRKTKASMYRSRLSEMSRQ